MITSQEFDNALKIILDYITQLEHEMQLKKSNEYFIDINNKISQNTFWVLKNYYNDVYNINLERNNLKKMSLDKLLSLNYETLRLYRGFGLKSEMKLRQILQPYIKGNNNLE